ncbi:putative NAD-specific glutamate dehydrogenase [Halorubrum aidingense JCM 13560]|uniref:Putative NAD-specific glutamate dehydrogenase n=1 Tax=Halorubrum aidingense JCM 13560 TaxID=1230454 RepID=M0PI38_9EURY|nr:putative NAD-specific glutamate dehydrogenase [Halorubrum aidingense JCM 13560]
MNSDPGSGRSALRVVFVVDVLEVGVDVLLVVAVGVGTAGARRAAHTAHAAGAAGGATGTARTGLRRLLLVHLLADLLKRLGERLGDGLQLLGLGVLVFERLLDVLDGRLDVVDEVLVEFLLVLLKERLGALDRRLGLVAGLDPLAAGLVLFFVLFGFLLHLLDLLVGEPDAALDGDRLGVTRALVFGLDVDDAVLVDVEGDLDLRGPGRRRRNPRQLEGAEQFVLLGDLAFALEDAHVDGGLVVGRRREHLRLLGGDRRVLVDEPLEQTAFHLDPERERGHVEQHDVVDVAGEHAALDRRAERDGLVGVHVLFRLLTDDFLDLLLDLRHPGRAADEDDLVDVARRVIGVGECLLRRADGALDEVGSEVLERRAGDGLFEVDRTAVGRGDEGEVNRGLLLVRQLDLRLLGGVFETLERLPVLAEVDTVVVFELVGEVVDERLVPVVATEVVVPVRGDDLVDAAAEVEDRHVERAATEVVHEDRLVRLVVEPVRHGGRGRLVDDALDLEAGDLAGVLRRLPLLVVEVGGDRDDRLLDVVTEVLLGVAFDLLEDHRRDLLGRVLFVADGDGVAVLAHVPLDRLNRAVRVLDGLVFRRLSDEPLVVIGERDDGGRRPIALRVRDDLRLVALHYRERGVGGTEVDTENLVARHLAQS